MSSDSPRPWPDWPESTDKSWEKTYKDVPREKLVEVAATGMYNEIYWREKYVKLLAKKTFPKMGVLISLLNNVQDLIEEIRDYNNDPDKL